MAATLRNVVKMFNEMNGSKSLLLSNSSAEFDIAFNSDLSAFQSPTGFKVHAIGFSLNIKSKIETWKLTKKPNFLEFILAIDFEDGSRLVLGVSNP